MSKMEVQLINEELLKELHDKATVNERLRQIFDLRNRVTMFATGKVTNERWTCAEEGFVLVTTTNLSATLREPSLSSER